MCNDVSHMCLYNKPRYSLKDALLQTLDEKRTLPSSAMNLLIKEAKDNGYIVDNYEDICRKG